ncbi:MAG: DUF1080 domain-containing protein [Anaerolineae bacterium]|nr:DUF1080 domain-containing protein [Anaerolineae bacterium]
MRRWIGWLGLGMLIFLAACSGKGPWREPFDEPGEWRLSTDAAADVTVAEGKLRIHVTDPGQIAWTSFPKTYRDFKLTVAATQVSGPSDNEYGVLIRMEGDERFYAFSISGDGYVRAASFDTESQWTILGDDWTPNDAVKQGEAVNLLEVEARGAQYTFRVNGQEVLQVEDAALLKGEIGLYAGAFTEGDVVVTFDDLEVASLK